MKNSLSHIAAAAALAASAFGAQANNVVITGFTITPPASLSVLPNVYTGNAGQMTGLLDGNSFTTYCTELGVDITFNSLYTNYSIVSGSTAWGATQAANLGKLLTYASGYVTNALTSAVIQAGVWEILGETTSPTYSFSSGNLQVAAGPTGTPGIQTALDNFSWAAVNATTSLYTVNQLLSPTGQNLLLATAVPEPESYALMVAGLFVVGILAQRRSRQG